MTDIEVVQRALEKAQENGWSALKSQYGSPMVSLTTTQRDLLHLLLTTELPIGVPAIGQQLRVTPRQVHYSLREIKTWLARHHTTLQHTPGVGIQVICSADQKQLLLVELGSQAKFQLILAPGNAAERRGVGVVNRITMR